VKPGEPGSTTTTTTTTTAITPNRDGLAAERDRLADLLVVRAALADTSDPELLAIDIVEDLIRSASDDVDEWGTCTARDADNAAATVARPAAATAGYLTGLRD
jgi:hypothetical protein